MSSAADEDDVLTPLRAHYLKKTLVQLQFARELDFLATESLPNVSTLSYLGPPFTALPKGVEPVDLPFIKYIFRQYVLTFPFMAAAPKDFYSQKLQPFVAALLQRNLTQTSLLADEEAEQATRKKLLGKIERNLSLFLGAATKLVEKEDVVRLTQTDLDRLEALSKKRQARLAKSNDSFEVNVVGVRVVVDKGRMRSRAHEEFIIRTRRARYPDVFVSRRYGDFKTLAAELAKAHPNEDIRDPPPKDRSYLAVPSTPTSPLTRQTTFNSIDSATTEGSSSYQAPSRLAREKNRLTLRAYLHSLMNSSKILSSPVLRSFLISGQITLTPEEVEDARRREEADRVREDGRKRFAKEVTNRVESLRDAVKSVKGDVMEKDGLTHLFSTIKVTPDIRDLPQNYRAVTEWARISVASTVFHHFVAADDASESFASLKRLHGLMPYFMLKTVLKISNPIAMIRGVLDLFMAQPFGGRSLLQRMFTGSLAEEVRVLQEGIDAVMEKVDDPVMCAKIRQFVYASRDIQQMLKADAAEENMNLVTIILRSSEAPVLSRGQMHRLARAHKAHIEYTKHKESLEDSDDDDGPEDEDAWLIEDLRMLVVLYSKLKDKEELIELIFEGFTADLLKDIITIFYSPLAQVYRAASIADSLGDLQNFINDLIRTVEQVEEAQLDPSKTVQAFIDLVRRHEQSFYQFVHKVHSKGEGLFDSLMRWIELFLTSVREGVGKPLSLDFILPHSKEERAKVFAEVDEIARYHYKLKVLHEDKIRKRFGRAQGTDADAEDAATRLLVDGVVGELSFGELVEGDAADVAAQDSEEDESSEYESSEYETDSEEDSDGSGSYESGSESEEDRPAVPSKSSPPAKAPPPRPSQPSTSSSAQQAQIGHRSVASASHHHHHHHQQQKPPVTRKRSLSSLSLKSMKSMNFSFNKNQNVPPVPPLPPKSATPPLPRTMPPSPLRTSFEPSTSAIRRTPSPDTQDASTEQTPKPPPKEFNPPPTLPKKKKTPYQPLKAPEPVQIKELLPVFVELMRPELRAALQQNARSNGQ